MLMFLPLTKWFLRKHPLSRALSPPERLMLRSPSHPSHRSQRHWKSPRWSRHFWPWPKNEHSDPVQRETNSQHKLHCGKKQSVTTHAVSLRGNWLFSITSRCHPTTNSVSHLPDHKAFGFFLFFFSSSLLHCNSIEFMFTIGFRLWKGHVEESKLMSSDN